MFPKWPEMRLSGLNAFDSGETSQGALKGNANAWKHGRYSAEAIARRRSIAELIRQARELMR